MPAGLRHAGAKDYAAAKIGPADAHFDQIGRAV